MNTLFKKAIVFIVCLVLISCSKNVKSDFFSISVNSNDNESLPLSEIAEKIEVIELEITDASLIGRVVDVIDTDDYFIIRETKSIILFDNKGKYIRQIGSVGQGPGEYVSIIDIAVDSKKERIFIYTNESKIICYDFNGIF